VAAFGELVHGYEPIGVGLGGVAGPDDEVSDVVVHGNLVGDDAL
jgi:hypothetical protein